MILSRHDLRASVMSSLASEAVLLNSHVLPACRQFDTGSFAFLQVPHWVALSSQRAVVLDLSAFGEPVFAALVPAVMASSDLAEIAAQHKIEPWDLYIDANFRSRTGPSFRVCSGSVLKFRPVGSSPIWDPTLDELITSDDFAPGTSHLSCLGTRLGPSG